MDKSIYFAQASDLTGDICAAAVRASEKGRQKLRRFRGRREPVTGCEDMAEQLDFCVCLNSALFGFDQLAWQGVKGCKTALALGFEAENSGRAVVRCCSIPITRDRCGVGLWWQKSPEKSVIGNKYDEKRRFLSPSLVTKINFCVIFGGRQW